MVTNALDPDLNSMNPNPHFLVQDFILIPENMNGFSKRFCIPSVLFEYPCILLDIGLLNPQGSQEIVPDHTKTSCWTTRQGSYYKQRGEQTILLNIFKNFFKIILRNFNT